MKSDHPPKAKTLLITSLAGIFGFMSFIGLGYLSTFFVVTDFVPPIIDVDPVAMAPVYGRLIYAVRIIAGILFFSTAFYLLKLRKFVGFLTLMAILFLAFYLMPVSVPQRSVVQKMGMAQQLDFSPPKAGIYVMETSIPRSQVEILYKAGSVEYLTDEPWINLFYQFSVHQEDFDFRLIQRLPLNTIAMNKESNLYNLVLFAGELNKLPVKLKFDIGFGSDDTELPTQIFLPADFISPYDITQMDSRFEYQVITKLAESYKVPPVIKLTSVEVKLEELPNLLISYIDRPLSMAIKNEWPELLRDVFGGFFVPIIALIYSILGTLLLIAINSLKGSAKKGYGG